MIVRASDLRIRAFVVVTNSNEHHARQVAKQFEIIRGVFREYFHPSSCDDQPITIRVLSYLKRVVQFVHENWYALLPESVFSPVSKSGTVSIELAITKDGTVAGMRLAGCWGDPMLERAS